MSYVEFKSDVRRNIDSQLFSLLTLPHKEKIGHYSLAGKSIMIIEILSSAIN